MKWIVVGLLIASSVFGQCMEKHYLCPNVWDSVQLLIDDVSVDSVTHAVYSDMADYADSSLYADTSDYAVYADTAGVVVEIDLRTIRAQQLFVGEGEYTYSTVGNISNSDQVRAMVETDTDSAKYWGVTASNTVWIFDKDWVRQEIISVYGHGGIAYDRGYVYILDHVEHYSQHAKIERINVETRVRDTTLFYDGDCYSLTGQNVEVDSPYIYIVYRCWSFTKVTKWTFGATKVAEHLPVWSPTNAFVLDKEANIVYLLSSPDGMLYRMDYNLIVLDSVEHYTMTLGSAPGSKFAIGTGVLYGGGKAHSPNYYMMIFGKNNLAIFDSISIGHGSPSAMMCAFDTIAVSYLGNYSMIKLAPTYGSWQGWLMDPFSLRNDRTGAYIQTERADHDSMFPHTPGHGVWIDGVDLKDGYINADSAYKAVVTSDSAFMTKKYIDDQVGGGVFCMFRQMGVNITNTDLDGAFVITATGTIQNVGVYRRVAGSADTTIIDISKNGTTIFTDQGKRPRIAYDDADSKVIVTDIDVTSVSSGDILTCDIDNVEGGFSEDISVIVRINE